MNLVFASSNKDEAIHPLIVKDIAQAQQDVSNLQALAALKLQELANKDKYIMQLVQNTKVLCKDNKLVVPGTLHQRANSWYHHYLQHPGSTCLEETLCIALYWKGMCCTSDHMSKTVKNAKSIVKNAKSTKDTNISMVNYLLSLLLKTLGKPHVLI